MPGENSDETHRRKLIISNLFVFAVQVVKI